jgi:hypothetical protein
MKVLKELLDMSSNRYNHMLLKQYVIKLERENTRLENENEKLKIRIGFLENPEFEPYPDGKEETHEDFWDCECVYNYIHKKSDRSSCPECEADLDDGMPDSRVNEMKEKNFYKGEK